MSNRKKNTGISKALSEAYLQYGVPERKNEAQGAC
jgi:hypothetical protein